MKIGDRVIIRVEGEHYGEQGTIYNYIPGRPCPWHVRPDNWEPDFAGIAYMADELQPVTIVEAQPHAAIMPAVR
jgi:hypothetical protein